MIGEPDRKGPIATIDVRQEIERLLEARIASGLQRIFGISEEEYRSDYAEAIDNLLGKPRPENSVLSLVEPRIPLVTQIGLSGVQLSPAVFRIPEHRPELKPYGVWLTVIPNNMGLTPRELVSQIPDGLGTASFFEGAGSDLAELISMGFALVASGIELGHSQIVFDRWLGKPRVTSVRYNNIDPYTGLLVKYI